MAAHGRELLRKYLAANDLTPRDFSRKVRGITEGMLSHYLTDDPQFRRNPGLANAHEIERGTEAKVPATSWIDDAEVRERLSRARKRRDSNPSRAA